MVEELIKILKFGKMVVSPKNKVDFCEKFYASEWFKKLKLL